MEVRWANFWRSSVTGIVEARARVNLPQSSELFRPGISSHLHTLPPPCFMLHPLQQPLLTWHVAGRSHMQRCAAVDMKPPGHGQRRQPVDCSSPRLAPPLPAPGLSWWLGLARLEQRTEVGVPPGLPGSHPASSSLLQL